jgi:hypothetical protein
MPTRTTPTLVAGIIEVDTDIPLDPFISAASSLVDRISDYAEENDLLEDGPNSGDKTRDDKLQEIETWLSAHFYTVRDPRSVSEGAGGVSISYQSSISLRLFTSHYGQMAAALDETGILESISAGRSRGKIARMSYVGKTPEELREEL